MARNAPTPGQKITYVLALALGSLILYFDITSNGFKNIKVGFKSIKISSYYLIVENINSPIKSFFMNMNSKDKLTKENTLLKGELDKSFLQNYFLSQENNFNADKTEIIKKSIDIKQKNNFYLGKVKSLDPNIFYCCDRHIMYIEITSDKKNDLQESVVFNKSGILGQVTDSKILAEVILLTDTDHYLPIKSSSDKFYCNARGSGQKSKIICSYNPLIWQESLEIGQTIFTSGLGGVYPENIEIGKIDTIVNIEPSLTEIEIRLFSDPLDSTLIGITSK
tara:strand:+ start:12937 stop:13773 length:837 start_codon:yes stop_codon:yes gene_type:complete